jgi:transcriptional regulator with XRE-family HTH domain
MLGVEIVILRQFQGNLTEIVGRRIKNARKEKNMTIRDLAESSGFSTGYISNLERGINSPTLDQLQKICRVLDINISNILYDDKANEHRIKLTPEEREILLDDKENGVRYELLTEGDDIEGISISIDEGVNFEKTSWGHVFDEACIIRMGTMIITMNHNEYVLNEGDTLYIRKNTKHTYRNGGKGKCISYWFYIKQHK